MEDLLTAHQVQDILKVDRITVYRMLQDGRLKGVKIGQQWRFAQREIDRLLNPEASPTGLTQVEASASFPTHCIQTIQDLFSNVGQISALVLDMQGQPLTQVSAPCAFCQVMLQSQTGQAACRASWQAFARQADAMGAPTASSGGAVFTCHAGLQYTGAPVMDGGRMVGLFLSGEFYWQAPDAQETAGRVQRLAIDHAIDPASLDQAARSIPVIDPAQQSRVQGWPIAAARAIQSILHERISFMDRLQQIATLTQIS